jgi:transposase-like protein
MVKEKVGNLAWLRKQLETEDKDLLRELVKAVVEELMSADADAVCGAVYRQASPERTNQRNGYRERRWDTRVGTIDLAVPRLRKGSYFPEWLLEPRRRSERALVQVISECYVRGVSTRRVDGLVRALGIEGMKKSQVSALAQELDAAVEEFRQRPLSSGPYPFLWLDAVTQRCREGGRVANVVAVVATAVNADGRREVLGMDIVTSEDGAGWEAFLGQLVKRGLNGVELVVSDDHQGLRSALAKKLPGSSWQRCRAHFMRNVLTKVPKPAQDLVATLIRSAFAQPVRDEVWAQLGRVVEQLRSRFPQAAEALEDAAEDILAFSSFPKAVWRQIWSNNPQERLNREIRRRTDVVGIFPNREAIIRLVGALLAEQTDEWAVARRYMTLESLAQATALQISRTTAKEDPALVAQLVA